MNTKLFVVFLSLFMAIGSSSAYAGFTSDKWNFENDGTDLVMEGATDDAFETSLSITDPTADRTIAVPNASGTIALVAAAADVAHAITFGNSTIVAEGTTADAFETTLSFTDPTADFTITIPTGTGTGYEAVDTGGATTGNVLLETEIDGSSELLALMDDETGTGLLVFGTTPTLTTPVIGAATGTSLAVTGSVTSSNATTLGWSVVAGANTACNTTCTSACVMGVDTADGDFLLCTDATADFCLCAGAS